MIRPKQGFAAKTEAVAEIISHFILIDWQWIASEVLIYEVNQNKDSDQRAYIKGLLTYAHKIVPVDPERLRESKLPC